MHLTWRRSTRCSSGGCVEVAWATSSFSGGNGCVEVGRSTSSFCSSAANCVEVAHDDGRVLVRDSKHPDAEPLSFQRTEWMSTVLAPVMLDRVPGMVHELPEGGYEWRGHTADGYEQALVFTSEEWEAFTKGVKAGEFNPPPRSEP